MKSQIKDKVLYFIMLVIVSGIFSYLLKVNFIELIVLNVIISSIGYFIGYKKRKNCTI